EGIREIEDRPDTQIEEIHHGAPPQPIDQVAGGAAERCAQPDASGPCLERRCMEDQNDCAEGSESPEEDKRSSITDEAQSNGRVQERPQPRSPSDIRS